MKVLLIGATGNVGLRLIPALLAHGHTVVTYIRSSSKLESLLPNSMHRQITIVQGSATDAAAIKRAILDHNCDGVINTAGTAALAPWGHTDLPTIFKAVVDAVQAAGSERQKPLRAWFLGGQGVLHYPGTDVMVGKYIPIYLEHRQNFHLLESLPANAIDWSMLCPNSMIAESVVPSVSTRAQLIANGTTPPLWKDSWMKHIPLIGKAIVCGINAPRYQTTLEQNAEFIAGDLETYESRWSGMRVGIIDGSK